MGSEEVMGIQWVKGRGTSAEGQGLHKPWGGQQGGEGGRGRGFALHGRGGHWDLGRVPNLYDGGTWSWGARCPSVLAHRRSAELQASDVWGK